MTDGRRTDGSDPAVASGGSATTVAAHGPARRVSPRIGPVQVRRAPEVLADELRDRILSGAVPPGAMLPAERDLADDAGLSRSAVREALGTLSLEGLLRAKLGRGGGYVVQQPPREAVVHSLDLYIRGRGLQTTSLLEVRDLIEPRCAALAARRRTDDEMDRLRSLTDTMGAVVADVGRFLDLNVEWHLAIADAGHNEILAATMSAIAPNIRAAIDDERYRRHDALRHAQRLHERIVAAIEHRDADEAGRLMGRHIEAATSVLDHTEGNRS